MNYTKDKFKLTWPLILVVWSRD